jgi:glycosyltransferase involved in cell wall biosynthesis
MAIRHYTAAVDHTFVIPVYRAAPNLLALIESLRGQEGPGSGILLATSTPSAELEAIAGRLSLPLHVNPQRIGIAVDWNFALAAARSEHVTLAHQDDYYAPSYVAGLRAALRRNPGAVLAFCDYSEHTPAGTRPDNINLKIKRVLSNRAFGNRECIDDPRDKVKLLSLGNPICCPSVMFDRSALADFRFPEGFQTNLDWMAWLNLARRPGGFVYVREKLVSKGVHAGSETTATIANRAREREDLEMFEALWPKPAAAVLSVIYRLGYRANRS